SPHCRMKRWTAGGNFFLSVISVMTEISDRTEQMSRAGAAKTPRAVLINGAWRGCPYCGCRITQWAAAAPSQVEAQAVTGAAPAAPERAAATQPPHPDQP